MTAVHFTPALIDGIDVVLLGAAAVSFFRRNAPLGLIVLLLALNPWWALAVDALHFVNLAATIPQQALVVVTTDAPLWAALLLGLTRLLRAAPQPPEGRAVPR